MPEGYEKPSVLDIAVLKDDPALVQFLLDAGADPNAMHGCFGSALHIACCSEKENQYEMIKMLLESGADVNLGGFDQDGRAFKSPLVEFLRSKDDTVSFRTNRGEITAFSSRIQKFWAYCFLMVVKSL